MISDILQPTHLLFVLVVALLVLGPKRLPEAGRALGKGIRDFRSAISGEEDHRDAIPPEDTAAPVPPQEAAFSPAPVPPQEAAFPPAPVPPQEAAFPPAPVPPPEAAFRPAATEPPADSSEHPAEPAEQQTVHPVG